MFGCYLDFEFGKEYYVFASYVRENREPRDRYVSKFVVVPGAKENPPNFEKTLDAYKKSPPQCP